MTITHADFLRILPNALKNHEYTITGTVIYINDPAGSIEITLAPEKTRNIASLCLPVTDIEYAFIGLTPNQAESFMKTFALSYQKGGG